MEKAAFNLLGPLEKMKSEEFGDTLDEISNGSDSCDPFVTLKSSESFKSKRKLVDSDTKDTSFKKFKSEESDDGFVEETTPPPETSRQRKSRLTMEENLRARREEKMKFIQHFVNISEKYSQFLEKKIDTKDIGDNALTNKNGKAVAKNGKKERVDISKQLKYFEGGSLRPYQLEGVTWLTVLFENCVNGILADEMGLGKTIQIIALFCHLYERKVDGPFLIVAPLSTLGNWEAEFEKFAPKIPVQRLQGLHEERIAQKKKIMTSKFTLDGRRVKPVILVSYQIPLSESNFLEQFRWKYIVVDEGHRLKNSESQLSQELRALQSENRTLLTGTPLQNDIKELWALFNFLMPELFKDIEGFSTLVELDDLKDKDTILANEAQTKIISTIHKVLAPFMLRREKKDSLKDIVPKKEMIIYCSLTEVQSYIYRSVLKGDVTKLLMKLPEVDSDRKEKRKCTMERKVRISPGHYVRVKLSYKDEDQHVYYDSIDDKVNERIVFPHNVPVKIPQVHYMTRLTLQNITMMLKKVVNHPYLIWCPLDPKNENMKQPQIYVTEDLIRSSGKLLVLDNLLPKLKSQGHKVLLFSTLTMFMDLIEEFLIMRDFKYRRLDGNVDYDERNQAVNDFQTDPEIFVFLLSTRAGGLGLNLTAADTVIFMDRDWNPMVDIQAQDRCHRIGQTRPVMIYSLIGKGTVDEYIVTRGDMKKRLEKLVIQEGKFKTLKKNPTDTDLKELDDLLKKEEQLTKIHANGLIYTNQEINQILDRSDLVKEWENIKKINEASTKN